MHNLCLKLLKAPGGFACSAEIDIGYIQFMQCKKFAKMAKKCKVNALVLDYFFSNIFGNNPGYFLWIKLANLVMPGLSTNILMGVAYAIDKDVDIYVFLWIFFDMLLKLYKFLIRKFP